MSDSREQADFRRHLSELRRAAGGLGHDFHAEFSQLDTKIERLGISTARDAKQLARDIEDDLSSLGRSVDDEIRQLPHRFAEAGSAIGSGTARAAGAARDAVVTVGRKTKEGTRNALAAAAGVRRTPMKAWSPPSSSDDAGGDGPGSG